jgi:GNAT superfamily N-acetyltransferase
MNMMPMVDPMDGLRAFNDAYKRGIIELQPGAVDPTVYVHLDRPAGEMRWTYVRLEGGAATALVSIIPAEPIGTEPCFGVGYAVLPDHRGQGLATDLVKSAIAEFLNGVGRHGIRSIHIEAVIGVENLASQRVAEKTINSEGRQTTDSYSSEPAIHYINRFST